MDRFVNDKAFDAVRVNAEGWWYERDRQSLRDARQILCGSENVPQFVVVFLMSSHYPYVYPPEYRIHLSDAKWDRSRETLMNRYRNALRFTDDAVDGLLTRLDPGHNLVLVTSDHGESFYEDGSLTHAGQLSEITCRTPLVMYGSGVQPQRIQWPTQHAVVWPSILQVLSGRHVAERDGGGRGIFGSARWTDQILLGRPLGRAGGQWELVLVRPEGRLGLLVTRRRSHSRVLGWFDLSGRLDPKRAARQRAAMSWSAALHHELDRWTPSRPDVANGSR
jgi:membrane-anchored protein YejM (alkaline phosphatase superfamily)